MRLFVLYIFFALVFLNPSPLLASRFEGIRNVQRVAVTCLRSIGSRGSFIYIDNDTARVVQVQLTFADLKQIARTGFIEKGGVIIDPSHSVLLPSRSPRVEESRAFIYWQNLDRALEQRMNEIENQLEMRRAVASNGFEYIRSWNELQLARAVELAESLVRSERLEGEVDWASSQPTGYLLKLWVQHHGSQEFFARFHENLTDFGLALSDDMKDADPILADRANRALGSLAARIFSYTYPAERPNIINLRSDDF